MGIGLLAGTVFLGVGVISDSDFLEGFGLGMLLADGSTYCGVRGQTLVGDYSTKKRRENYIENG